MDLYKKQCFLPWGQPWFECRSTQNIRLKKAKGRALHSKSKFLFRLCCWYYANCFWRFTPCSDVYCVCINVRIQPFGWRVYLWLWLNKMFPQVFLFWTLIFKINMEFPKLCLLIMIDPGFHAVPTPMELHIQADRCRYRPWVWLRRLC